MTQPANIQHARKSIEASPQARDGSRLAQIESSLDEALNEIGSFNTELRRFLQDTESECCSLQARSKALLSELRGKLKASCAKRDEMKNEIEKLRSDLEEEKRNNAIFERELADMKSQTSKLESSQKRLEKVIAGLDARNAGLDQRVRDLQRRREEREKRIQKRVDYFRKYLGINLASDRPKVLRVEFTNMVGAGDSAFVCLDFSEDCEVVEISPKIMSVDEAQRRCDGCENFYEFVKEMRANFLRYYSCNATDASHPAY